MPSEDRPAIPVCGWIAPAAWSVRSLLLAVVVLVAFGTGHLRGQPEAQRPLVFLADAAYPPVSFLEDGVAKGFDADLARG